MRPNLCDRPASSQAATGLDAINSFFGLCASAGVLTSAHGQAVLPYEKA